MNLFIFVNIVKQMMMKDTKDIEKEDILEEEFQEIEQGKHRCDDCCQLVKGIENLHAKDIEGRTLLVCDYCY